MSEGKHVCLPLLSCCTTSVLVDVQQQPVPGKMLVLALCLLLGAVRGICPVLLQPLGVHSCKGQPLVSLCLFLTLGVFYRQGRERAGTLTTAAPTAALQCFGKGGGGVMMGGVDCTHNTGA
jgi:hypothetical protein